MKSGTGDEELGSDLLVYVTLYSGRWLPIFRKNFDFQINFKYTM
jgi:hypothetical protein